VALFDARGGWLRLLPLAEACAVAASGAALWAGGRGAVRRLGDESASPSLALRDIRLDNHWIVL
jgi:hypothetical protein